MPAREHIGFTTAATAVPADAWRVSLFCKATGETDPVYTDEAAARAAGHRARPLPPTYLKAIEGEHFNGAALLRQLQLPMLGVLHAEQSFEFLAPLHVGDTIEVSRTVTDVHDKKGGALTCIVVDSDYRVAGRLAARSRQTILVRNTLAAA